MPDQPNETHSPGPLEYTPGCLSIVDAKGNYIATIGASQDDAVYAMQAMDARLLCAAYNSYDKHFGPSAVSAAEGDKLGDLMKVAEMTDELQRRMTEFPDRDSLAAAVELIAGLARKALSTTHAATRQEQPDER
jgi:hypothetical protein